MTHAATDQPAMKPRAGGEQVEPFLFGAADARLYGCLHRGAGAAARRDGVLLCQPYGPEYIRSHRAMRQLAGRLVRGGFSVMRFDYFGCGDSAGDDDEGEVGQWIVDVKTAAAELRRRAGVDRVIAVGLRLGGSLAALSGAEHGGIDQLVLWDPILDGSAFLDDLAHRHRKHMEFLPTRGERSATDETCPAVVAEVLGFRVGEQLAGSLAGVALASLSRAPARRVLVIESTATPAAGAFLDHLRTLGPRVEHQHLPDHEIWLAAPDKAVVPGQILQSIVTWIARSGE